MISVIMTSYLGDYPGARSNPRLKFKRAVDSFMSQTIGPQNCELVIVSDGCEITNELYEEHYKDVSNISLIKKKKSDGSRFPGHYRQAGINSAKFEYITYLDSDDFLLPDRLIDAYNLIKEKNRTFILDSICNVPDNHNATNWILQCRGKIQESYEANQIKFIRAEIKWRGATCQFVHKKDLGVFWKEGPRGEDYIFADAVYRKYKLKAKDLLTPIGGYVICHHPKYKFDV